MNCAVGKGKITDKAKEAIEAAGGHIEDTKQPDIVMAVMPDAEIFGSSETTAFIELPTEATLRFTRAWHTSNCALDLVESQGEQGKP
jgi:hypothetical protein